MLTFASHVSEGEAWKKTRDNIYEKYIEKNLK